MKLLAKRLNIFEEALAMAVYQTATLLALTLVTLLPPAHTTRTCVVDNFAVVQNFDKERFLGKWYMLSKKGLENLFLEDNFSADYFLDDEGNMAGTARSRVNIFGLGKVCADIVASFIVAKPELPSKMFINYHGLGSYHISKGQDFWVIDTDYESFALIYSCSARNEAGLCTNDHSLLLARSPRSLPPATQRRVRTRQDDICLLGQFTPLMQNGACA